MTDRPLTDLERQTRDFERQSSELMVAHPPTLIGCMNELDFADLAASLDWPVESSAWFLVETWDEHDEASARELLLSARMVNLDDELTDEGA